MLDHLIDRVAIWLMALICFAMGLYLIDLSTEFHTQGPAWAGGGIMLVGAILFTCLIREKPPSQKL